MSTLAGRDRTLTPRAQYGLGWPIVAIIAVTTDPAYRWTVYGVDRDDAEQTYRTFATGNPRPLYRVIATTKSRRPDDQSLAALGT